ncbi:MAG: 2Fe-2S iron-sulfur cluster-binding protein, partial [Pseudomonadota bacterium]
MAKEIIELIVNGQSYEVGVHPWQTLAEVLREEINLTGTKVGCNIGDCGACTVLIDGQSVSSCLTLAVEAQNHQITTVEGLSESLEKMHPIQEAFV